jgi:hypothetical protein
VYSTIDDAYISLFQRGRDRMNLAREGVDPHTIVDSGINTLVTALPINDVASPVFKGLSAPEFSSLFKGTFVPSLAPKMRGFLNVQLNSELIKKQAGLAVSGTAALKNLKPE